MGRKLRLVAGAGSADLELGDPWNVAFQGVMMGGQQEDT